MYNPLTIMGVRIRLRWSASMALAVIGLCACGDDSSRQTPRVREIIGQAQVPTPPTPISKSWAAEPTGYRGVDFGTSLQEAKNQVSLGFCFEHEGEMLCSTDREIADVPVHEVWTFRDGKLVSVFFTFNSGNYSTLREIFVEKYGPPSTVRHESLQTLMGARDENEIQTWKGEKVSVLLSRYFKKITEGVASIETNAYSGAVSKEADAKKRRAKEAL